MKQKITTIPQTPRLHVIFARDAHKAVVIRRGPSHYYRLSLWHTDTDMIEHGQWLHGRVYEESCDISPDGSLFIYAACQPQKAPTPYSHYDIRDGYSRCQIAISRPPYFTALALWGMSDFTSQAAWFIDNHTIQGTIFSGATHPNHRLSDRIKVITIDSLSIDQMRSLTMPLSGWVFEPQPESRGFWQRNYGLFLWHKYSPNKQYLLEKHTANEGVDRVTIYNLVDNVNHTYTEITGSVAQMDWDQRGRLICAKDGKLWVRDPAEPNAEGTLIEDFNGQTFEPIPPPDWAKQW